MLHKSRETYIILCERLKCLSAGSRRMGSGAGNKELSEK